MQHSLLRTTLAIVGSVVGCAVSNTPPAAPRIVTIDGRLPSFAPLAQTKELQEKGGIRISVSPVPYQLVRSGTQSDRLIQPSFMEKMSGPEGWQYMRFVERTHSARLDLQPTTLRFVVTINNQLPRVFRGAGTVVQFNIAGKLIGVDQAGYADLVNMIVPPRTQQQVEIYGPPIESIPDQTTVGLFLYDVVTRTDNAGNTIEKQNFEWYFNFSVQLRQDTTAIRTERLWIR